jgi:hypothetical protein
MSHDHEQMMHSTKALFGPPPVLSTEEPKQFDGLFDRVIACLKPRDTVELILIRHFVYAVWEIERLTRYGTVSIERWYRETLQLRARQEKLQKARKEDLAWKNAERNSSKPADIAQLVALEDSFLEVLTDTDEIMERRATEFEHNRAFGQGILFQERLDKLMASRIARRNDALQQLDRYRAGLGHLAQKAADEVLDAEFEEIKSQLVEQSGAPSLTPSKESEPNDVAAQDHGEPAQ